MDPNTTLPVSFKYVLNKNRAVLVEGIKIANEPRAPLFLFETDDKPLGEHKVLVKVLKKAGRDLSADGEPTAGCVPVTLKGADLLEYYSPISREFHFKSSALIKSDTTVSVYDYAEPPASFVKAFNNRYARHSANKKYNLFIEVLPEEQRFDFQSRSIDWSVDELQADFIQRFEPVYQKKLRATLDAKFDPTANTLQTFIKDKFQAYASIGLTFGQARPRISFDLADETLEKYYAKWSPKDLPDLLAKAKRYDDHQVVLNADPREQMRGSSMSRVEMNFEEEMNILEANHEEQNNFFANHSEPNSPVPGKHSYACFFCVCINVGFPNANSSLSLSLFLFFKERQTNQRPLQRQEISADRLSVREFFVLQCVFGFI